MAEGEVKIYLVSEMGASVGRFMFYASPQKAVSRVRAPWKARLISSSRSTWTPLPTFQVSESKG